MSRNLNRTSVMKLHSSYFLFFLVLPFYFFSSSTTFRWLCSVFVVIWLINFLLPFPNIFLNCLYMYICSSTVNIHCHLSYKCSISFISFLTLTILFIRILFLNCQLYVFLLQHFSLLEDCISAVCVVMISV
jgi:hypothetical protein